MEINKMVILYLQNKKGLDKPLYILVVGTDDNNPSQSDSLFLLSINLDQKTMDVIGIPSNSKIDNRDQTDASMLNSIYEKVVLI